jgi:polysaccharide export outer membrane protein
MTLNRLHLSMALLLAGCGVFPALAEDAAKSPADLVQFVEKSRQAGQKDEQIRKTALAAGWKPEVVDQALAAGRQPAPEPKQPAPESKQPAPEPTQPAPETKPAVPEAAREPEKNPKDLMLLVDKARKAGQKDEEIRKSALAAGWTPALVDQAFTIARQSQAENPVPESYKIGAGDVLQIVVWKELDASVPEAVVRSDNKITLPLIKEVEVGGLTPVELEKKLTARLSEMINNPNVTVIAKSIRSQKIYMLGAVKKEGPIMMVGPMTVLQAIGEAGGLTDYAKRKKIYILRNQSGKQVRLPFDYDAVLKGQRMELNVQVMPDDTIVVPN